MKSVLVYDYMATGEGHTLKVIFTNSYQVTDEDAVAKLKESIDPYFHRSIELLPLESIEFNVRWMNLIKAHVPVLHNFITGDKDFVISVDYKFYVNYS
jgi:hypothetical protein